MKKRFSFLNNEKGSVLLISVMFLMLLTVIGIFAITTSTIEIQISGNDKINKMVFYAADSGIDYVAVHPAWYGSNNIDKEGKFFPDNIPVSEKTYQLSTNKLLIDIKNVSYLGKSQLPSGSGFSAGQIFAINYKIISTGTGPNNGTNTVEAGFYRIGL